MEEWKENSRLTVWKPLNCIDVHHYYELLLLIGYNSKEDNDLVYDDHLLVCLDYSFLIC